MTIVFKSKTFYLLSESYFQIKPEILSLDLSLHRWKLRRGFKQLPEALTPSSTLSPWGNVLKKEWRG